MRQDFMEPLINDVPVFEVTIIIGDHGMGLVGVNRKERLMKKTLIDENDLKRTRSANVCLNRALEGIFEELGYKQPFKIVMIEKQDGEAREKDTVSALVNEYIDKMENLSVNQYGEGSNGCHYDLMVEPDTVFDYGVSACRDLFLEFVDGLKELEGGFENG